MARRPFDPAELGLRKTEYRQGDVLDRAAVDALVADADVVVHLAFIIMGGREESRRINLEGSENVFAAAAARRACSGSSTRRRSPPTASTPATRQPLTEDVPPRGSDEHYYSAEKAELEAHAVGDGRRPRRLRVPALHRRRAGRADAVRVDPVAAAPARRSRVLPDTGIPFQLVHHDDVASALVAAVRGAGAPGIYNLAGPGELTPRDLARALGWHASPPRARSSRSPPRPPDCR